MGNTTKSYESPLSPDLSDEILALFQIGSHTDSPKTIRDLVQMIDETNARLAQSPVAKIVAHSIMQSLKKRGDAHLAIRHDGQVVVRISYGEPSQGAPRVRRDTPLVQAQNQSDLPYLDELRAEATRLGIDVSHLGRQRRAIHALLAKHR